MRAFLPVVGEIEPLCFKRTYIILQKIKDYPPLQLFFDKTNNRFSHVKSFQ